MANKNLFVSTRGPMTQATNALNSEGVPAYALEPKQKLAQYALTGCLSDTFYASAEVQLQELLDLSGEIEPAFLAKTAIHARTSGYMKDVPALLLAILSTRDTSLLWETFDRVIDNAKMLRNFVQIMRSGVVGRKSLGSAPKRLVKQWLENKSDEAIFFASIGNAPSLADVIKMVHPTPQTPSRAALYGYLLGRDHDVEALPEIVKEYESFKSAGGSVPKVPFLMLTSLKLDQAQWREIAINATWQQTRMNLATFARHGVFEGDAGAECAELLAKRLRDAEAIASSRVMPYQLLTAYKVSLGSVPAVISEALQDAMEVATANVPVVSGKVFVMVDVSGSMASSVTGYREGGSYSAVACVDVAALMAASILRKNPQAEVIPFEQGVVNMQLNPRDSIMTNAQKLSALCGGGTNCSAPMARLNKRKATGDLVIYVSDNESWVDYSSTYWGSCGTKLMKEWNEFRGRNPEAKMVCIDIQPNGTSQAGESDRVMNIGGFSDSVFKIVAAFAEDRLSPEHWVGEIEAISL